MIDITPYKELLHDGEKSIHDYDVGTEEYEKIRSVVDTWNEMLEKLDKCIMETAT